MTPAINQLKKARLNYTVHQYTHDPAAASYGLEAAEKLNLAPEQVFKTLVVSLADTELVVAVVPVACQLNMKLLAKAAGAKKAAMAAKTLVEKTTGYLLGGVSPVGQKKPLRTFIDSSAQALPQVFVSAGRRGLEIELEPQVLAQVTRAQFAPLTLVEES